MKINIYTFLCPLKSSPSSERLKSQLFNGGRTEKERVEVASHVHNGCRISGEDEIGGKKEESKGVKLARRVSALIKVVEYAKFELFKVIET